MTDQGDEPCVKMAESEIAEFFSGCKVLITSGLGLMGKLLIEKLLRCCPNVATLYVLTRGKNGKNASERVQELYELPLYERLRKEQPDFPKKLTAIAGDFNTTNLGLSLQDRKKLLDANIIFHGAPIIRSNQKLRTMTNINVESTKQLLLLAREMPNLKVLVHISTVFAQAPLTSIDEVHYPAPMETDELLSLTRILNDKKLESITPTLIGEWPDTFTFTKAIAEDTVLRYGKGLPVCIVRPSIVTSTWKEPTMGWADSVYGPIGLLAGASLGLLRTIHCHSDKKLDFVPADYATSGVIAAAWQISERNTKKLFKADVQTGIVPDAERVPVYNYVSSNQSSITWNTFRKHVLDHGSKIPGVKNVRLQCMFWNSRLWVHKILLWLFHLLPAVMVDAAAMLAGLEPRWYKAYQLINDHLAATSYFMTEQWYFKNDAMVKLWKQMNATDRKLFEFDMSNFDWNEYIKRMVNGIRVFVSKTPWTANVEEALAEYKQY